MQDRPYSHMVSSPVGRLLAEMALPAIVSNLVTVIYSLVDALYLGHLSVAALAASGAVMPLTIIFKSFSLLFGMGAANKVSVCLGKKEKEEASAYAFQGFWSSIAFCVLLAVVCLCLIHPILRLLGSTSEALPLAALYLVPILIASPVNGANYVLNPLLRFQGHPNMAMEGLCSGLVLNIIFEPLFIFKMGLGILGAGICTALCQVFSFIVLLIFFEVKSEAKIGFKKKYFRSSVCRDLLFTGLPSLLRNGMRALSLNLVDLACSPFGTAALAGVTVANRVITLFASVRGGIGQGYQPICGYAFGAGEYARSKKAFKTSIISCAVFLVIASVISLIFAPQIVSLFQKNPAVISKGGSYLRFLSATLSLTTLIAMFNMNCQTLGRNVMASCVPLLRHGLYLIPWLFILPHFFGYAGVEICQPIADVCTFLTVIPMQVYVHKWINKLKGTHKRPLTQKQMS